MKMVVCGYCAASWRRCVVMSLRLLFLLPAGLPVRSQGESQSDNKQMDNITIRQGETLFLSCSQGDFVTHTAWLNRSSILYAGEDKWSVDPRVSLVTLNQDEFTIKIEDVDLTDEGQYICAVQTSSRPRTTSVHIIVQVPPKILNLSKDLVVNEGSNVILMCLANGKPEPAIGWSMLSPSDDSLSSDSEILEIPFISRNRAGVYECTAANEIAVDTQTVELTVNYPPSVSDGRDVGVTLGQRGVLQCEADAVPEADFEWYRDDRRTRSSSGWQQRHVNGLHTHRSTSHHTSTTIAQVLMPKMFTVDKNHSLCDITLILESQIVHGLPKMRKKVLIFNKVIMQFFCL
uniref:Neurotrimin n=1 Tax=Cyprinus carpio carpio TaxID=630221 RepID=A0A9J8BU83_CYPCA